MSQLIAKVPPKAKGILYIVLAAFFFSLMTFFVKLSGDVPSIQKVFFRNIVAFVIAFVGLARSEEKFHVRKDSWGPRSEHSASSPTSGPSTGSPSRTPTS